MSFNLKTWLATAALAAATACTNSIADPGDDPIFRAATVNLMQSADGPTRTVEDASAHLATAGFGATMTMTTQGLAPGHVTTAWWVIINKPALCETRPCTAKDGIGRSAVVKTQIVYADGVVNAADGSATFSGMLPAGPVTGGWYDQDFDSPNNAEIHLVLNDHGPLIPEIAAEMLTTYRGGCTDESLPPPFPASAKADGIPGPNRCRLIQNAIFLPASNPTQ